MKPATCSHSASNIRLSITASIIAIAAASVALAQSAPSGAQRIAPGTVGSPVQQWWITTAQSAGPSAISNGAAIAVNENGKLRTVRQGSNGWTCFPSLEEWSGHASGGMSGSPICVDKNGLDWIQAWLNHKDPTANTIGIAFMLQGESGSETDPYAEAKEEPGYPTPGRRRPDWIDVGPHVMILGASTLQEGLSASVPADKSNVDTSKPFVMWPGTPYEHLMIPVGAAPGR